jgi:UDP-N-acetylmuramate dehydrogenase
MTREQRQALAALLPAGNVCFDEPMERHSAVAAGGPAEAFVRVADVGELSRVVAWCCDEAIDYRFWGAGSAILVRDGGMAGLLIALGRAFEHTAIEREVDGDILLAAGAAVRLTDLAAIGEREGLVGLAPFAGEPGTLGGALCAAEGLAERCAEVTIVTKERRELTLTASALRIEEGRLKMPRTAAIVRALLRCARAGSENAVHLVGEGGQAIGADAAPSPRLAHVFRSPCKTEARILIEEAGLAGVRVGAARVLPSDANAIANEGQATVRDIVVLMNLMRDRVREHSGITLLPAIEVWGER